MILDHHISSQQIMSSQQIIVTTHKQHRFTEYDSCSQQTSTIILKQIISSSLRLLIPCPLEPCKPLLWSFQKLEDITTFLFHEKLSGIEKLIRPFISPIPSHQIRHLSNLLSHRITCHLRC